MQTQSYPLRIPESLIQVAKFRSAEEHIDQSTALRQLLHNGAEEYVIKLVHEGRISIGKGAELLGLTIYDMYEIAKRHGLRLGASSEQFLESQENLKVMLKKK